MSVDADRLKSKIAALRAKTRANGCTEAEARAVARGILAAAGDAVERTFPHPAPQEAGGG